MDTQVNLDKQTQPLNPCYTYSSVQAPGNVLQWDLSNPTTSVVGGHAFQTGIQALKYLYYGGHDYRGGGGGGVN